jgi:hypothetical protein
MTVFGGPDIVTDGLVLHLDAANRKSYPGSGSTWYDLSGKSLNMTMVGTGFTYNNSGSSYFDMSSDSDGYFEANTANFNSRANITTQLTYIAWVKFLGVAQSWQNIFGGYHANAGNQISLGRWSYSAKYWYEIETSTGNKYLNNPTANSIPINTWTQMGMTTNTSNGTFLPYINGSNSGLNASSSATISGTIREYYSSYPRIGYIPAHGLSEFLIGAVYAYNRQLTSTEMMENYNALKGRFGL